MIHGSLFNGIGGFQLAADWMGWENVMSCEVDEFCSKVTKYHFPNCIQHGDIKTTDFSIYRGRIDILTGGFPCQPFSIPGKRKGTEDDRHLWPEMLRAIREISPRWIVGENVRGLTNWNGGLVFDQVQSDLENEGYEVTPFLLPACAVNSPHRRDRIWFVAHANGIGIERLQYKLGEPTEGGQWSKDYEKNSEYNVANPKGFRQQGSRRPEEQSNTKTDAYRKIHRAYNACGWPSQPWVRRSNDGIPRELDGITFSEWAKESIKSYGNAIVPQVAYQIFKAIEQYENTP